MPNGILIVGEAGAARRGSAASAMLSSEWGSRQSLPLEGFNPGQMNASTHRLLLVDTSDAEEAAQRFFEWLRLNRLPVPVMALLRGGSTQLARLAARAADECIALPIDAAELNGRIANLLGAPLQLSNAEIAASLAGEAGLSKLIGCAPEFQKVLSQVRLYGANDAPVLLTGETGTGKELCARVIHLLSRRHLAPFIPVDCASLPDHLFENEIFGHARGAFTDARSDQKGLVALAQHGTLFLDEIDSLSPPAQSKLLRLLQERSYRPLGSEVFKQADLRILVATNRNLEEMVGQKQFRSDLFFRINVLRIHLPALRDRRSDIALLSEHFIGEIARSNAMPAKKLSRAAEHKLEQHGWPGNVRELYNILQRAVLSSPGTMIAASAIDVEPGKAEEPAQSLPSRIPPAGEHPDFRRAKMSAIQSFERGYVSAMMAKHDGNVTQAAREAGKDRRAFGRLAKKYESLR